jgi:hypothetical protein
MFLVRYELNFYVIQKKFILLGVTPPEQNWAAHSQSFLFIRPKYQEVAMQSYKLGLIPWRAK